MSEKYNSDVNFSINSQEFLNENLNESNLIDEETNDKIEKNIIVNNICQSFKILKEMLIDRKYNVDMISKLSNAELIDQHDLLSKSNKIFYQIVNDDVMVIYDMHSKFQKNEMKLYLDLLAKSKNTLMNIKHIIFIFKIKITSQNEKNLKDLLQQKSLDFDESIKNYLFKNMPVYETFHIKNLLFNITKHSSVPKHEKVMKENQDEICKKYNLKKNQFPIILKSDPVSKYFYLQQGDLVKITRSSPSVGEVLTYRLCV